MATHGPMARATVHVDPAALQELKTAVLAKHGSLYGRLHAEISLALREHAKRLQSL